MDKQNLESTRDTAQIHVQRCLATCPSSAACRHRHKRGYTRKNEPYFRHFDGFTRSVKEVMQGGVDDTKPYRHIRYAPVANTQAFGLTQTVIDTALTKQRPDKCATRQTDCKAFIQKAMLATRLGLRNQRARCGVTRLPKRADTGRPLISSCAVTPASQSGDRLSMKLTERNNSFIKHQNTFRSNAKKAFSTGQSVSQTATQATEGGTRKQSLRVLDETKQRKTQNHLVACECEAYACRIKLNTRKQKPPVAWGSEACP